MDVHEEIGSINASVNHISADVQSLFDLHTKTTDALSENVKMIESAKGSIRTLLWILGFLQPAILGACVWMLTSVMDLRTEKVLTDYRIEALEKGRSTHAYPGDSAFAHAGWTNPGTPRSAIRWVP